MPSTFWASPSGAAASTLNVLREVLRLDVDSRYLLLLNHPEPELEILGPHVEQVLIPMRHPWGARLWAQGTWPLALRRRGVDLVHHMKNHTALGLPGPTVVTIYDLTTVLHPAFYTRADVAYWRHVQPRLLRRAEAVVAISERTAEDLRAIYRLDPERVHVIYPAYDPRFRPRDAAERERVRDTYRTGRRYILHVGSLSVRKNLLTLLMAFEALCAEGYAGNLVLAGRQYPGGATRPFTRTSRPRPFASGCCCRAPCPMRTCRRCTARRNSSSIPPATKGLASSRWRRWPAGRR